jgi:hypothetical protein
LAQVLAPIDGGRAEQVTRSITVPSARVLALIELAAGSAEANRRSRLLAEAIVVGDDWTASFPAMTRLVQEAIVDDLIDPGDW